MASTSGQDFDSFYKEIKEVTATAFLSNLWKHQKTKFQVEKRDENLTPAAQIERLTKPGHTYRNLNPFEVLQVRSRTIVDSFVLCDFEELNVEAIAIIF